eukprot:CAMPEP_0117450472 /NCGR_PEP_ID=MMETSP0759-20121206/8485_1 /TAXON_ID=63605 /ORGANISM="Percolomonas cosmopolitus, Strain WS" /LENGTH=2205 /DNA_ID=CAMNT_0005242993 /DNA_START=247 /DNA_END=6861 /DNA_ORIENTATION=+
MAHGRAAHCSPPTASYCTITLSRHIYSITAFIILLYILSTSVPILAQHIESTEEHDTYTCYGNYPSAVGMACMGRGTCVAPDYCFCEPSSGYTGPGCSLSMCHSQVQAFGIETGDPLSPYTSMLHFELFGDTPAKINPHRDPILFLDVGATHAVIATRKWVFTLGEQPSSYPMGRGAQYLVDKTPKQVYIDGAESTTSFTTFDDRSLVSTQESIQGVCAGTSYSYFWTNKRVFCTGETADGQCGTTVPTEYTTFTEIPPQMFKVETIRNIRCGEKHALALAVNNTMYHTGNVYGNTSATLSFFDIVNTDHIEEPVTVIEAGAFVSFALTVYGRVYVWGSSQIVPNLYAEIPVELNFDYVAIAQGRVTSVRDKIVHLSCKGSYVLMTTARGEVISWGKEIHGNLAHDDSRVDIPRLLAYNETTYVAEFFNEGTQAKDSQFELDKSHAHLAFAGSVYTSFVVSHGFKAWSFGNGLHGLLGNNVTYGSAQIVGLEQLNSVSGSVYFASSGAMSLRLAAKLYSGNQCGCPLGKSGEFCDQFNCFGVNRFADNVCFGRGTCKCPDHCECAEPDKFGGIKCNPICFGSYHPHFNTCSSHGQCIAPDTCECEEGWTGVDCSEELFECYDIIALGEVCGGHGMCLESGVCTCDDGYSGTECTTTTTLVYCFGIESSSLDVCSGHGTCGTNDTCTCAAKYDGDQCEFPVCFGLFNSSDACSSHGKCSGPDTCTCENHYTGSECEMTSCFGVASDTAPVCSSHGNCTAYNQCECALGSFGENCEQTLCSLDTVKCNGRGTCNTTTNSCACDDYNTTLGHFTGENCERCEEGYYGINCNTTITHEFLWRDNLVHLRGAIAGADIADESALDCEDFFPANSLRLLGTYSTPECQLNSGEFIIILGDDAKLRVVEHLQFNMLFNEASGLFTPSYQYAPIRTMNPVSPPEINFDFEVIVTNNDPFQHNPCENIGLVMNNVPLSYPSGDLWKFQRFFSVSSAACPTYYINQYLYTLDPSDVTPSIPAQYLFPACDYTIFAEIRNRFCQSKKKIQLVYTAHQLSAPVIQQLVNPHSLLNNLNLKVSIPSMTDSCYSIYYEWTFSPPLHFSVPNIDELRINHGDFPFKDMDYDVTVMALSKAGFSNSTAGTTLQVRRPPVVASIAGGSQREIRADGSFWILDGTPSYDPYASRCGPTCVYTFTWECADHSNPSLSCPFTPLLSNNAQLSLPSHIAEGRDIVFTLKYENDGRVDYISQIVKFIVWIGAKITVEPPPFLISDSTNTFRVKVLSSNPISNVKWYASNGLNIDSSKAYGPVNGLVLTLKENVLTPGLEYIFTAVVTAGDTGITTTASVKRFIYRNPHSGQLHATPSTGVERNTPFAVSATNWVGDHMPLEYQFGYEFDGIRVPLNDFSPLTNFSTTLPVIGAITFYANVRDTATQGVTFAQSSVVQVFSGEGTPTNDTSPEVAFEGAKNLTDATEGLIESGHMEDALDLLLTSVRSLNAPIAKEKFPLNEDICALCDSENTAHCEANKCVCDESFAGDLCTMTYNNWNNEIRLRQRFFSILDRIVVAPTCARLTTKLLILEGILRNRNTVNNTIVASVVRYTNDLVNSWPLCSLSDLQLLVDVSSNSYNGILSWRAQHPLRSLLEPEAISYVDITTVLLFDVLHKGMSQTSTDSLTGLQQNHIFNSFWVNAGLSRRMIVELMPEDSSRRRYTFDELVTLPSSLLFDDSYEEDTVVSFQLSSWGLDVLALERRNVSYATGDTPVLLSNIVSMRLVDLPSLELTKTSNSTVRYKMLGDFSASGSFSCYTIDRDDSSFWSRSESCKFVAEDAQTAHCECDFYTNTFADRIGVFFTPMDSHVVPPTPEPVDPSGGDMHWLIFLLAGVGVVFCCCSLFIFCIVVVTILLYSVLVLCSFASISRKRASVNSEPDVSTNGSVFEDDFDSLHNTKEQSQRAQNSTEWAQSVRSSTEGLDEAPRATSRMRAQPSWDSTLGSLTYQSGSTGDSTLTSTLQQSSSNHPSSSQSFGNDMEPSSQGFTNFDDVGSMSTLSHAPSQSNMPHSSTLNLSDIPLRGSSGSIVHLDESSRMVRREMSSSVSSFSAATPPQQSHLVPVASFSSDLPIRSSSRSNIHRSEKPNLKSVLKSNDASNDDLPSRRRSVRFSLSAESLSSTDQQQQSASEMPMPQQQVGTEWTQQAPPQQQSQEMPRRSPSVQSFKRSS